MANLIDYVRSQKESFEHAPLNRVDSLVFSWLAYFRIPEELEDVRGETGMELSRLMSEERLLGMCAAMHDPNNSQELARAVAKSPRFGTVLARLHVDSSSKVAEKQFAALCFELPNNERYVAFRGTDNTLIGWKEDFNMAFSASVPAQVSASAYLKLIASLDDSMLYVGGHSKGGNLAVYAALSSTDDVYKRLKRVFSHDGPGFCDATREMSSWRDSYELVDKTIPQESIIGLLMEPHWRECTIVRSSNPGIMQHAPFSWECGTDDFVCEKALTLESYTTYKRINSWLESMSADERERIVETLYKLVQATGEVTFSGLSSSLKDGSLSLVLKRLDGLDSEERTFFLSAMEDLVATLLLGPSPKRPETAEEKLEDAAERIEDASARFDARLAELERRTGGDS